ncbi:syntaxin-18 [Agrilus planipennis]|uniref:Syntaxin-18 n=1 Tax=Agrilus planipennis TaxID=224129 RepID=A0A1W4WHH3_AGRPL|nr:syntaxin-18 [Agrilus planipennis]
MDLTLLFKACIKTVRTTNKMVNNEDTTSTLLKVKKKDPILKTARDILKKIRSLEDFLRENKATYLNVINYISTYKTMSETDKGKVDSTAEEIINYSKSSINSLRDEIQKNVKCIQKLEHYSSVVQSLEKYLKDVSKLYAEAKAIRVKRVVETHKISKLELENNSKEHLNDIKDSNKHSKSILNDISSINGTAKSDEGNLTMEEMQMFESENDALFLELNSLSDEVKQMETKVVHIAELQELFTEKVLQQEIDIDRIATTVVSATDNMKYANEQIRQAIQRNAGLRIWLLFFLLVMSFSLLFLDWYND